MYSYPQQDPDYGKIKQYYDMLMAYTQPEEHSLNYYNSMQPGYGGSESVKRAKKQYDYNELLKKRYDIMKKQLADSNYGFGKPGYGKYGYPGGGGGGYNGGNAGTFYMPGYNTENIKNGSYSGFLGAGVFPANTLKQDYNYRQMVGQMNQAGQGMGQTAFNPEEYYKKKFGAGGNNMGAQWTY